MYVILKNEKIAENTYEMRLAGPSEILRPGQFVNVKIDGFFLRRPISVCDYEDGEITLIYKVVGGGTEKMSRLSAGERLDVLFADGTLRCEVVKKEETEPWQAKS